MNGKNGKKKRKRRNIKPEKQEGKGEVVMQKLYAAPLEGVTTYIWRDAHRKIFGGADKYYTPFLSPNGNLQFQTKELREVTRGETDLVPQLLTNRAEYFIWGAEELQKMGYREVNLNLGCPSGTVVAKHKGSGLLADLNYLDEMLDEIFDALPDLQISVKTRIGRYETGEWERLLEIFNRYPIAELTVHPRVQKEFYEGTAHRDIFLWTKAHADLPLVYNGDVTAPDDTALGYGCAVMIGRGLAKRPALLREIRGGEAATREELAAFHDAVFDGYERLLDGALPAIYRMREFWNYLACPFMGTEPYIKQIRKVKTLAEYQAAAQGILQGCELIAE